MDADNYKTKYSTGQKYYATLKVLYDSLQPFLQRKESHILNKEQLLLVTVMKLRLGEDFKSLACRFNVSEPVVSKGFSSEHISFIHKTSVFGGMEEKSTNNMSACFPQSFGNKVTSIIDCTEIFIETPSNQQAAAECFHQYKHHHTITYLIAVSPLRAVTYISEGYGARASDGFITCGLLDQLRPGDKGFRIDAEFALRSAKLEVPAFVIKKRQLHPLHIERTREIANVRIHVKRIIGTAKLKYMILENTIPISMWIKRGQYNVAYINMCPSITYAV